MKYEDSYRHKGLRNKLVQTLKNKGIKDKTVIKAIGTVPRHIFFEQAFLEHAYQDKAFPIGEGQTISQPYTVARQTELLEIRPGDKILEIGTGSGYQCAILCELKCEVHSIEINQTLHNESKKILRDLGYKPNVYCGDGTVGLPQKAPFDGIIVTAGAPHIPSELIKQLNTGGKLIIPVGDHSSQTMYRFMKKSNTEISKENHGSFAFVPLVGKDGWH